mmetsp:Transcript_25692/g.59384  ORF Transcript_25692/g.59384 Transcript_25692/m.59384 type:complete len:189 (+) Transcript_25692:91-657(+)
MAAAGEPLHRHKVTPVDKEVTNIKVILLGEVGTGKTTLAQSFCGEGDDQLRKGAEPTLGADFRSRIVEQKGKDVRVNIWDVSGHPHFVEVRNEFYKEVHGVLYVYDTTSRKSFQALDNWHAEFTKNGAPDKLVCCVVGTKTESGPRMVSDTVAREWAKTKGFAYFEVSAFQHKNIEAPFQEILAKAVT